MKGPWAKFETANVMARLWAGQNIMNAKLNGPARPDNSSGCFVGDWLFSDTQFKYAPTAWAELDRVGIARMFETLGNFKQRVHDASPMLISRRVYCALRDGGAIFDAMPLLSSEEPESPEDQAIIDFWERPSK